MTTMTELITIPLTHAHWILTFFAIKERRDGKNYTCNYMVRPK